MPPSPPETGRQTITKGTSASPFQGLEAHRLYGPRRRADARQGHHEPRPPTRASQISGIGGHHRSTITRSLASSRLRSPRASRNSSPCATCSLPSPGGGDRALSRTVLRHLAESALSRSGLDHRGGVSLSTASQAHEIATLLARRCALMILMSPRPASASGLRRDGCQPS